MKLMMIAAVAACALASCADVSQVKNQAVAAPTPAPETEWRPMLINTEPQGAAIVFNGENVGYSPVTVNIEVVKSNGKMASGFLVQAIPTAPGQYTQSAGNLMYLFMGDQAPPSIILYMYQPTQAR
jgi:hypothetical protein